MKTILYATDYSKNSVAALKYAQKLSTGMKARLVITHVLGYPIMIESAVLDDLPEIRKINLKADRTKLEAFCKEHLGNQWKALNIEIVPIEDMFVADGIIGVANDRDAELIIVGNKGESALQRALLGNVTKKLIKKALCPVLCIPSDSGYSSPKTIVYATDFEEEDVNAIQKLTNLAEHFKARIKIVHISTKKEYSGETQMEWFKTRLHEKVTYKYIDFKLLFSENIFESLRIYLNDVGADLVVMLERKNSGFLKKMFQTDKVKKMESYGKVPLLSFNKANLNVLHFSLY